MSETRLAHFVRAASAAQRQSVLNAVARDVAAEQAAIIKRAAALTT